MKVRVLDHTGDSLQHFNSAKEANGFMASMRNTHFAYDADTHEIIHGEVSDDTQEVIMTRKIVAG